MAKLPIENYLAKLLLLESRVGVHTSYDLLTPFRLNTRDAIDVQDAAKRIATFIGLEEFTFIIGVAKQKENVGGHIDLRESGKDVFIEISNESLAFPQAVLTTLAHEITHKYLHVHKLYLGYGEGFNHENEVLTDIAAVYLGLGKLMLNGSECQTQSQQRTSEGIETTTRTLRSGYLTLDEFAFVYRLVCGMRRIPEKAYFSGLFPVAIKAIRLTLSRYKYFFKTNFHDPEEVQGIKASLERDLGPIRVSLDELERYLGHTKDFFGNHITVSLQQVRAQIQEMSTQPFTYLDRDIYNPSLKFLLAVKCDCDVNSFEPEIGNIQQRLDMYVDCVSRITSILRKFDCKLFNLSLVDLPKLRRPNRAKAFIKKNKRLLAKLFRVEK